jgi:Flp pilus assembly protein TadD
MAVGIRSIAIGALCALLCAGCGAIEGARLYREGTHALDRGDAEQAVIALERAAERAPEASEVQNHLGLAYLALGRRGAARLAFERALALDCANDAARHNLAIVRAEPLAR